MNRRLNQWRMSIPGLLILAALNGNAQQGMQSQSTPAGQSSQPQIHAFSLKQAVDYAAQNSVRVKNALLDYQIQQESNRAIVSEALPQVTGSAGYTDYFQTPVAVAPGSFLPVRTAATPNLSPSPFAVRAYGANCGDHAEADPF